MRKIVLADSAQRLQAYQVEALHREKLVSLGTLAAGLMHELHNPGSAAKRAASQLRENLLRLQQISLRGSAKPKTPAQIECMKGLLEHALRGCNLPAMSSVEQADAEEAMSEWLSQAASKTPTPSAPCWFPWASITKKLPAPRNTSIAASFSDALNWFGALVSSVTLVCAIEESISRITELVMAVKKFAYDERTPGQGTRRPRQPAEHAHHPRPQAAHQADSSRKAICGLALHHSTRAATPSARSGPTSSTTPSDASPEGARSKSPRGPSPDWLVVCIGDQGSGIAPEVLPHIFEPFFTTKPQGSGTGLGLEIVHRIMTQKFGGTIDVQSKPGNTRFIVRLPITDSAA